jgi:hypothetical protein
MPLACGNTPTGFHCWAHNTDVISSKVMVNIFRIENIFEDDRFDYLKIIKFYAAIEIAKSHGIIEPLFQNFFI